MGVKTVLAPIPGTFYRSAAPDQPALKNEGDAVAKGDVIGIIEVMKTFTQIQAEEAGQLVRFLVDDEDAVMAGQPLYELGV
ncbi:acetyl-CoA carboxylase [Mesorhizobium amorphae]|uniref:acetyl-CoA carboxylase n=1 Tax=Mesorhizobium amorphae TaxID=71433 RepID=UPI00177FED27|nr:acetyl-CoA carboxylase [Mesorhizobium amorphae]